MATWINNWKKSIFQLDGRRLDAQILMRYGQHNGLKGFREITEEHARLCVKKYPQWVYRDNLPTVDK